MQNTSNLNPPFYWSSFQKFVSNPRYFLAWYVLAQILRTLARYSMYMQKTCKKEVKTIHNNTAYFYIVYSYCLGWQRWTNDCEERFSPAHLGWHNQLGLRLCHGKVQTVGGYGCATVKYKRVGTKAVCHGNSTKQLGLRLCATVTAQHSWGYGCATVTVQNSWD